MNVTPKLYVVASIGATTLATYPAVRVKGDTWRAEPEHHGRWLGVIGTEPTRWWGVGTGVDDAVRVNSVVLDPGSYLTIDIPGTDPTPKLVPGSRR